MGLISRVSSRTYRKQETESLKWPSPKPKQNPLPKKPTWSNDEKSSKKPENTPPNMPPKLRPSSTTPKPPRPTETTTFQMNQNWLWSSESEVSTNCLQNQRRPSNSFDSDKLVTPCSSD